MTRRRATFRLTKDIWGQFRAGFDVLLVVPLVCLVLSGCEGPQSALDVAGGEAAVVQDLFWVMVAGAVAIWAIVIGIAIAAVVRPVAPAPPTP